VYFSKAEEKLAQRYARLDAARRSPPASSAPPVPPPAPAPPAGDGTPPAAGTGAAPAPAPDAPLELDVPAGLDAADPLLTELKASGAKLGLDREKAGKVLELHQRVQAAQDAQLAAMHEGWQRAARADEEIGGDGSVIAA